MIEISLLCRRLLKKMIEISLCNKQTLGYPKAKQKIDFKGNLDLQVTMLFIIKAAKETILDFSQGIVKVL